MPERLVMVVTRHMQANAVEFFDASDLPIGKMGVDSATALDAMVDAAVNANWIVESRDCPAWLWFQQRERGDRTRQLFRPRCAWCGTEPALPLFLAPLG